MKRWRWFAICAGAATSVWVLGTERPPTQARVEPSGAAIKPLGHVAMQLAVRPTAAQAQPRKDKDASSLPAPLARSDETAHAIAALSKVWDARPQPPQQSTTGRRARLPQPRSATPHAMQQAFERMAPDPEWARSVTGKLGAERARLQRVGVQVASMDCRIAACRLELLFSGRAAVRRRERLAGSEHVSSTDSNLVHTFVAEDGTVRSVVFLARPGNKLEG